MALATDRLVFRDGGFIEIGNDGPALVQTNYWDLPQAQAGFFYASGNAGAYRLLVPDVKRGELSEMKTGKSVVMTRGRGGPSLSEMTGKDLIELLFDDGSDSPYVLFMLAEQFDRLPEKGSRDGFAFHVYTRDGLQFSFDAHFRRANKPLPDMRPWA
jgi:hypothetical protein